MPRKRVKGPLKKVVSFYFPYGSCGSRVDVLECGHHLRARQDIAGDINANRRVCWKCNQGEPPDEGKKQ